MPHNPPQSMRVCLVSRANPADRGVPEDLGELAAFLMADGHEVHLLGSSVQSPLAPLSGLHVHPLPEPCGPASLPGFRTEAMRHAFQVHEALTALHAARPFELVVFPASGGPGYFALRAKAWSETYPQAVLALWMDPSPAPGDTDERPTFGLEALELEHLEADAARRAALVLATDPARLPPAGTGETPPVLAVGSPLELAARLPDLVVELAAATRRRELPSAPASDDEAPDVSIIVPFYNLDLYLPETLRSIDAQTCRRFEVIIVDDGSTTPESKALLARLEAQGWRIVRKPNGGLSSARNAGIAVARGRWILPLDADDLIAPTFLEKALQVMEANPSLAYATSLVSHFSEFPDQPSSVYVPWGLERDALTTTNVASTCTALLSRQALLDAGGYDERLRSFEDWDLYCTFAERGLEGAVIPEFLFHYRQRPGSLVHTEVARRRHALHAYLLAKHPALAQQPDRALRAMLGEVARAGVNPPLRHRAVDAVNEALKRIPLLQPALKRGLALAGTMNRRRSSGRSS